MTQSSPAPRGRLAATSSRRTPVWIFAEHMCRFITTVVFDLKVYGSYHVPKTGGALLVSNHQSYLDPILLGVGLDRTISYMAKAELFKNPFFARLIRSLNAFPIEQGTGDLGAMKGSIARLNQGDLLNVFPEGSRTDDGKIAPMEKGVAVLIRRAKVPVIPVVIDGSFRAWSKHRKFPQAYPIRVMFGPAMHQMWELDRGQIIEKIDVTLHRMFDDLQAGRIGPNPPRPVGR